MIDDYLERAAPETGSVMNEPTERERVVKWLYATAAATLCQVTGAAFCSAASRIMDGEHWTHPEPTLDAYDPFSEAELPLEVKE